MFTQSMNSVFINQTLYPHLCKWSTLDTYFSQMGWKPPLFWCNFSPTIPALFGNHHCFDATFPLTQPALVSERYSRPNSPYVSARWVAWKRHCWGWWLSQIKSWGSNLPNRTRTRNTRVGRWISLLRRPYFMCYGLLGSANKQLNCFFWCAEDVRWFFSWLYVDVKDEWDAHRTIGCYFEVYWSLLNICRCVACVPVKNQQSKYPVLFVQHMVMGCMLALSPLDIYFLWNWSLTGLHVQA